MSPIELLEQRAERGTPRGASEIWAGTQNALRSEQPSDSRASTTGLRVALALSAAALVVFAGLATDRFGTEVETITPATTDESTTPTESVGEPAPILIEGMELVGVGEPWSPAERDGRIFTTGASPTIASTRVYAMTSNPFAGPVVGIDSLEGGGFSPWSMNLTAAELSEATASVERDGDSWRLPHGGELVEVARFAGDSAYFLMENWQFNFRNESAGATLHAQPAESPWVWIARLLRNAEPGDQSTSALITILDGDGVLVGGEAFWHRDGFAYRLTASETVGDTTSARPAETVVEQLQLVEREAWTAAVDDANSPFSIQTGAVEVGLALLMQVGWSGTVLGFAVWKKRRIVPVLVLIAVAAALWILLAPSFWFLFVLLILSLAAYGLLRSTPRAE